MYRVAHHSILINGAYISFFIFLRLTLFLIGWDETFEFRKMKEFQICVRADWDDALERVTCPSEARGGAGRHTTGGGISVVDSAASRNLESSLSHSPALLPSDLTAYMDLHGDASSQAISISQAHWVLQREEKIKRNPGSLVFSYFSIQTPVFVNGGRGTGDQLPHRRDLDRAAPEGWWFQEIGMFPTFNLLHFLFDWLKSSLLLWALLWIVFVIAPGPSWNLVIHTAVPSSPLSWFSSDSYDKFSPRT